jgi:hypothetical protein
MAVSDDIFQLIKSMSRAEKAYFRRYAKMKAAGKELTYLKLFNHIAVMAEKNKVYNENLIKRNCGIKSPGQFPVLKNNLYNLTVDSLCSYRTRQTPEEKVRVLIDRYDSLYAKALFRQCRVILKKALRIAYENELLTYHFLLLGRERVLARYSQDITEFDRTIDKIHNEQSIIIDKIRNNTEVTDLSDKFTSILQKNPTGFARNSEDLEEVQYFMSHPLLSDESKILTAEALSNFLTFKTLFCQYNKDFEGALIAAKRRMEITGEKFARDHSRLGSFVVAAYGVLIYSVRTRKLDDYDKAYSSLKELPEKFPNMSERNRIDLFYYSAIPELSLCNETLDMERGRRSYWEIKAEYEKLESKIPTQQKIILLFFIAIFNFMDENYRDASVWLGKMINMPNVDLSQDYQCYARIVNLVVQYELGNIDSLEYALKSTYHYLSKRKKAYLYEKIVLDYLRKSFRVKTKEDLIELFAMTRNELLKIKDDPYEQNAFDAFNLIPWLDSKIENIPFVDAARKQISKKAED